MKLANEPVKPKKKPVKKKVVETSQPKSERDQHIDNMKKLQRDKKVHGAKMILGMVKEKKAIHKDGIKNA